MPDSFSRLVAAMDSAMVVVTTAAGGERDGCLVGFHSQCSIHPPRYVIWLSKANRTYELATRASHLAVHLLDSDDHPLAELFGGTTGDRLDKLAGCEWTNGPGDVPLLAAADGHFVGRISEVVEPDGDHVGFVVEPIMASDGSGGDPDDGPLRLSEADDIEPGHPADDRR